MLLARLRNSGLLDLRIRDARTSQGWDRRSALLTLGRTRAPEAVPALVEALESPSEEPASPRFLWGWGESPCPRRRCLC